MEAPRRYPALDGLRGLAAVVVVVHHVLLTSPNLAAAYAPGGRTTGAASWLAYSPLHAVWAGREAVLVFFVLSGFVLTLPFLRSVPSWSAYYASRLVRLYLPVWGSIAIATALFFLVARHPDGRFSWWLNEHPGRFVTRAWVDDAVLIVPYVDPRYVNSALWSLRYEVLFSLALPAYLLLTRRGRLTSVVLLLAAVALSGVGSVAGSEVLQYLPVFAVGVLLASRCTEVLALAGRLGATGWTVLATTAWLLLTLGWWASVPSLVGDAAATAGAALVVFCFLGCRTARHVGESEVCSWLGRISFSLYLVHEPIVVTLALCLPRIATPLLLLLSLGASMVVAVVFRRLVEAPAHRLSRRVGARVRQRRPSGVRALVTP